MRIIITHEGTKEIISLSNNSSMKTISKYNPLYEYENKNKELIRSNSTSLLFSRKNLPKIKNRKQKINEMYNKSKYISSFNLSEINPQFIKIKQSKLQIPPEQSDLYDSDKYTFILK